MNVADTLGLYTSSGIQALQEYIDSLQSKVEQAAPYLAATAVAAQQSRWFPDVIVTLATVALLVGFYYFVLQPQIRIRKSTRISQQCPDRWLFNGEKCEPRYETSCLPFSPNDPNMQSYTSQCEFAKRCGTNWGGMCQ